MFGFSVAVDGLPGPLNVIERVAAGRDLGIIARQTAGPWWLGLRGEQRPQIMAILPFIRVGGRPADLPAFVISPPLSDPKAPDFTVFVVTSPHKPAADGLVILAAAGDQHWLVADAGGRGQEAVAADLPAGAAVSAAGGFAAPIGADGSALDPALLALVPGGTS
jgi:chorismate mutase/prephenate dehydratase